MDLRNSINPARQLKRCYFVANLIYYFIDLLTVNSEFSPQITSLSVRVGAQPRPSIEFCRNRDRQISPFTEMFGCQSVVKHFTFGGCKSKMNNLFHFELSKSTISGGNERDLP